jgi:prolyl-tRNA synthetase
MTRLSQLLLVTLREDPADADVPSHRLLARGGFIVRIAAGIYAYTPLMWRTLRKVAQIVREEMDRAGAQEIMMPILQPSELWQESGRWNRYLADGIMFHLKDKKGALLCLGPTHEEVVTTIVKKTVGSYKQLPVNLYQIQDKFRDEIRPRFGLMRGREFIMKDAYSFDVDAAGLEVSYRKMDLAYRRIFERCGLAFTAVEADAGAIGGSGSQEFMVTAETGEDAILHCASCGYAANVEKAASRAPAAPPAGGQKAMSRVATPGIRTVEQLVELFRMPAAAMAKTLLYEATFDDRTELFAVLMRGDLPVNEVKLQNATGALAVRLAPDDAIAAATGAETGFAGPVGLPESVKLLADLTVQDRPNLLTGCNETGFHCLDVNLGRDTRPPVFADLRKSQAGEGCPRCADGILAQTRGIEVGHIFKLGTKYSEAMDATFTAEDGKPRPFVMGCYGIGVSRTAAAAVEQNHDDGGIIWPPAIAPFSVVVAILDVKKPEQVALGERLYDSFRAAGFDPCLDDRKLSPGSKFKDLDLLGFPVRVVVGRGAAQGIVEVSARADREGRREVPAADALEHVALLLAGLRA